MVRINKGQTQPPGQLAPDGGLARAREADKDQARNCARLSCRQLGVTQLLTP
jgi:hypothetical protein